MTQTFQIITQLKTSLYTASNVLSGISHLLFFSSTISTTTRKLFHDFNLVNKKKFLSNSRRQKWLLQLLIFQQLSCHLASIGAIRNYSKLELRAIYIWSWRYIFCYLFYSFLACLLLLLYASTNSKMLITCREIKACCWCKLNLQVLRGRIKEVKMKERLERCLTCETTGLWQQVQEGIGLHISTFLDAWWDYRIYYS